MLLNNLICEIQNISSLKCRPYIILLDQLKSLSTYLQSFLNIQLPSIILHIFGSALFFHLQILIIYLADLI